jgi:uncharacterized membrane protein YphA (DoxX/SURF4 family)
MAPNPEPDGTAGDRAPRPFAAPDPYSPGPRVRSLIALILRLGLGLQVLNAGLTGYLHMTMPMGPGRFGNSSFIRLGVYPGSEGIYQFVPYAQIVVGLALMLGFLTAAAAAAAGAVILFPSLAQAFILTTSGMNIDPFMPQNAATQIALNSAGATNLLLVAAVLWFSTVGGNAWSLDGLMFARGAASPWPGRAGAAGRGQPWPDPLADRAAAGAKPLVVEFDPDLAVGGETPKA